MDAEKKNYYEVLEVDPGSSPDQIETAYIRARNAYAGESVALYSLMTKDECDAILTQIEEAYSVIGFPEKRREYDRVRGFNLNRTSYTPSSFTPSPGTPEPKSDNFQYENFGSNLIEAKVSKITAQKKFGLEYEENNEMERKIAETSHYTGTFLKEIREYKNVTLERMSEMTRISKTHLNALESEDLTKLPAEVFVRGYVYQYAKVLKLNPDSVAASYLMHFKSLKARK